MVRCGENSEQGLACLVNAAARLEPIEETNRCYGLSSKQLENTHKNQASNTNKEESNVPGIVTDDDESKPISSTRKKSKALPLILMELLLDPAHSEILTFTPDGDTFTFLDVERFEATLLKDLFKIARFSTFERKLEMWGFRRDNYISEEGSRTLFHPRFRRGDWHACRRIRCGKRASSFIFTTVPAVPVRGGQLASVSLTSSVTSKSSASPVLEEKETASSHIPEEIVVPSTSPSTSVSCLQPATAQRYTRPIFNAVPACQSIINNATRQVVGAALGVLIHDKVHAQPSRIQHGMMPPMMPMGPAGLIGTMPSAAMSLQLQAELMMQQQRRKAMMGLFPRYS